MRQWKDYNISFFSFSDKDIHYIEADVLMGTLQNAESDR